MFQRVHLELSETDLDIEKRFANIRKDIENVILFPLLFS